MRKKKGKNKEGKIEGKKGTRPTRLNRAELSNPTWFRWFEAVQPSYRSKVPNCPNNLQVWFSMPQTKWFKMVWLTLPLPNILKL